MNIFKIAGLAAAGIMLAACQSDSYKINGECDLLSNGDTIFITNDFSSGKPFAHSVVNDGKFTIEGTIDSPTLCIAYSKSGANATFFVEPGTVSIKIGDSPSNTKVGGTEMNDKWQTIMDSTLVFGAEIDRVGQLLYNSHNDISHEEKSAAMARIENLQGKFNKFIKRYAEQNISNSFGMFMVLYYQDGFTPEELMSLISRMPDELRKNSDIQKLLAETKSKTEVGVGGTLPDFTMNDIDGNPVKLRDEIAKHNVTLIDFWASWCGPCRAEMPYVKALYENGFHVIGISLDDDKDKWTSAVKNMGMTWLQLSDLNGWHNQIAVALGVNSIPHTVVVDKNGKILARGLRGERLRDFMTSSLE